MKCDELKAEQWLDYSGEPMPCYPKAKVDAAIDELKSAHHKERHEYIKMIAKLKQKLQDQCISCPVKMQEDYVVAELKQKLEDAKATAYAESVDAGMRERRLKRALWIARAEIAHKKIDEYWPDYCHNAHSRIALLKWEEVERKCRAKAEEYK